jgi:hypothetical protein
MSRHYSDGVTPRERPLHFLHIGKTGGTAVKHALRAVADSGHLRLHGHDVHLADVRAGRRRLFLPARAALRFVSAFYSRPARGTATLCVPWSPAEDAAFSGSARERARERPVVDEHRRTQESRAGDARHPACEQAGTGIGCRRRLPSLARADLFFIGLQEHLAEDFAIIRARLGLPESLRLPDDDVDAHRNPASVDRSLDAQAIRNCPPGTPRISRRSTRAAARARARPRRRHFSVASRVRARRIARRGRRARVRECEHAATSDATHGHSV